MTGLEGKGPRPPAAVASPLKPETEMIRSLLYKAVLHVPHKTVGAGFIADTVHREPAAVHLSAPGEADWGPPGPKLRVSIPQAGDGVPVQRVNIPEFRPFAVHGHREKFIFYGIDHVPSPSVQTLR